MCRPGFYHIWGPHQMIWQCSITSTSCCFRYSSCCHVALFLLSTIIFISGTLLLHFELAPFRCIFFGVPCPSILQEALDWRYAWTRKIQPKLYVLCSAPQAMNTQWNIGVNLPILLMSAPNRSNQSDLHPGCLYPCNNTKFTNYCSLITTTVPIVVTYTFASSRLATKVPTAVGQ